MQKSFNNNGELIKQRENEWSTKECAAAALPPTSQRPDTDRRFHRDAVSTQDIWEEYDRNYKGIPKILYGKGHSFIHFENLTRGRREIAFPTFFSS